MGIFSGTFYDVTPVITGTPRVLYLLHGLGGDCEEWTRFSKIEYYAKKYNFIIVLPEVGRSFYCDTAYGANYFTYVADELPAICGKWFRLDSRRENTFIAGESMGGYGAVKIGLSRPWRFSAIASLSGVLDYAALSCKVLHGLTCVPGNSGQSTEMLGCLKNRTMCWILSAVRRRILSVRD